MSPLNVIFSFVIWHIGALNTHLVFSWSLIRAECQGANVSNLPLSLGCIAMEGNMCVHHTVCEILVVNDKAAIKQVFLYILQSYIWTFFFRETFIQFPSVSVASKAGILSQDMLVSLDEPNLFLCLKPNKIVVMNERNTCAITTKNRKFNLNNHCCNIKKCKHSVNIYSGDWCKITTFITMTEHITAKHCDSFWWSVAEMTEFYCSRLRNYR